MRVCAVIGNPRVGGRTTIVATAVAQRLTTEFDAGAIDVIELGEHTQHIFEWENPELAAITERVASSTFVVFACPTYKASFTGLLKAFLDRYGSDGLAGVTAVPVMLGGSPHHSMAPDTQLRPVLVELGARVPSRSLYVVDSELDRLDETIDSWWSGAGPALTICP